MFCKPKTAYYQHHNPLRTAEIKCDPRVLHSMFARNRSSGYDGNYHSDIADLVVFVTFFFPLLENIVFLIGFSLLRHICRVCLKIISSLRGGCEFPTLVRSSSPLSRPTRLNGSNDDDSKVPLSFRTPSTSILNNIITIFTVAVDVFSLLLSDQLSLSLLSLRL